MVDAPAAILLPHLRHVVRVRWVRGADGEILGSDVNSPRDGAWRQAGQGVHPSKHERKRGSGRTGVPCPGPLGPLATTCNEGGRPNAGCATRRTVFRVLSDVRDHSSHPIPSHPIHPLIPLDNPTHQSHLLIPSTSTNPIRPSIAYTHPFHSIAQSRPTHWFPLGVFFSNSSVLRNILVFRATPPRSNS